MQIVAPAPTIRPMMYAIRILFIWFFFLGWLFLNSYNASSATI